MEEEGEGDGISRKSAFGYPSNEAPPKEWEEGLPECDLKTSFVYQNVCLKKKCLLDNL